MMTTPLEGTSITSDLPDASSPTEWCLFCSRGGGSSHLIHSQLLLRSAVSDSDLIACRSVCPQTPTCFSRLMVEVPAKPLQPSPTAKTCVLPPCCAALSAYSIYILSLVQVILDFPAPRHGQLVSFYTWVYWVPAWMDWGDQTLHFLLTFTTFSCRSYTSCCPGVETR